MWTTEWRAIGARIAGLLDAGAFLLSTKTSDELTNGVIVLEKTSGDTAPQRYILGAIKVIEENAWETGNILQQFFNSQATQLPDAPRSCLRKFVEETRFGFGRPNHLAGLTATIAAYASFRSEFEYLIVDTEAVTKSLVARAMTHLQSSIAGDEVVRIRWRKAFDDHETACERLGACQLLLHGIWSFKASTTGARTDLVLSEDDVGRGQTRFARAGSYGVETGPPREPTSHQGPRGVRAGKALLRGPACRIRTHFDAVHRSRVAGAP